MAREKKDRFHLSTDAGTLLRKSIFVGLCCMVAFALIAFGIFKVYAYVEQDVAYSSEPPKVVLKDRPTWMSDLLAEQICEAARPPGGHSALNRDLPKNARIALQENMRTNAWIREIRQLKLVYGERPGDTLVLDCEFRAPIALVKWQDNYYLVDAEGVILPEKYSDDQISKIVFGRDGKMNIRVVEGVRSERPAFPGQHWVGDDLKAALDMIKVLYGKPFTEEIIKVEVANYEGRDDGREAQIVLYTRRNTQVRWGRPVASTDLAEIRPAEKLRKLEQIYAQYSRIDAGEPWIDIRFDRVTKPAGPTTAASAR